MRNIIRASTLHKILVLFLILTIPFYVMSIIIYHRSNDVIRDNILSHNQTQLSGSISILEKDMEIIQKLQTDLVNNRALQSLAFSPENLSLYETVLSKRELQSSLDIIRFSSRYIRDVRVFLFAAGTAVSSEDGITEISEPDYPIINACLQNPPTKIFEWKDRLFIGFFYPGLIDESLLNSNPRTYLILTELDGTQVLNYFNLSSAARSEETVLHFLSGEYTVSTSGDAKAKYLAEQADVLRQGQTMGTINIECGGNAYLVAYQYSAFLNTLMLNYVSEATAFQPLAFYRNWLIVFMVVSIFISLIFSYMIYITVHRPLYRLSKAFRDVTGGDLNTEIEQSADEFAYIYTRFNEMVGTIRRLINESYEQKILLQQAEFRQLQSKINPHFLYNAFFSISTIAYAEGGDVSSALAQKLGQYFRYVTREVSESVPLVNELAYAKLYAEIQEMRFSNRLRIIFDELPDEAFGGVSVPPFILQPLIENALEHGLANKISGGVVRIGLERRGQGLIISVEDNGDELDENTLKATAQILTDPPENKKPDALCNINIRLKIFYGGECEMTASRSELGGLRVEIEILPSEKG